MAILILPSRTVYIFFLYWFLSPSLFFFFIIFIILSVFVIARWNFIGCEERGGARQHLRNKKVFYSAISDSAINKFKVMDEVLYLYFGCVIELPLFKAKFTAIFWTNGLMTPACRCTTSGHCCGAFTIVSSIWIFDCEAGGMRKFEFAWALLIEIHVRLKCM